MQRRVAYRAGYKYQLAATYTEKVPLCYAMGRSTEFITLTPEGELIIRSGYAWDGPSGPTFDTPSSIRGSLVHDALYQLLRAELLPIDARDIADQELYRICVEDGMWKWRARLWLRAVRKCAAGAADPVHKKPLLVAPRPLEVDLTAFL